jgi:hypothetical protein
MHRWSLIHAPPALLSDTCKMKKMCVLDEFEFDDDRKEQVTKCTCGMEIVVLSDFPLIKAIYL